MFGNVKNDSSGKSTLSFLVCGLGLVILAALLSSCGKASVIENNVTPQPTKDTIKEVYYIRQELFDYYAACLQKDILIIRYNSVFSNLQNDENYAKLSDTIHEKEGMLAVMTLKFNEVETRINNGEKELAQALPVEVSRYLVKEGQIK